MSAEGSSSESSSDSSSTSASDSSRGGGVKKFQFSSAKSTSLAGWAVSGLDDARTKSAREAFRPKLKKNADLLINPNLDEAFYIRLKTVKSSSATKANIDPIEKIYRNQTFKILDLVKPIMFLASRTRKKKKSRADAKAVKTALKLWAVLYHDITNARRRNILAQIYPQNIGLLDDKAILPAGGEHLFGPKFTQALVEQVKTLNALENAGGAPCPSGSNSGQRQSNRGFSQPPSTSFSGGRYSNFNGSRYVQTILAFDGSFGGRIARFAVEWSKLTLDPWILSTVSQGLHLDFISEPVQFTIQPNACMDAVQHDCCEQEVHSLLEKGAIIRAREQGFISSIFLIPKRTGGYRPIINLKALNRFLYHRKFKMEGISSVKHTIREGDWLTKLDLKDAYLTVPISEGHRKFLQFKWGGAFYLNMCPFPLV